MTTAHSPLRVLKAQADAAAQMLKAVSRGEASPANDPTGKIKASLESGVVKFAIAMDDKIVTIEMTWDTVRGTSEVALAEYLLKQMRGQRDTVQ